MIIPGVHIPGLSSPWPLDLIDHGRYSPAKLRCDACGCETALTAKRADPPWHVGVQLYTDAYGQTQELIRHLCPDCLNASGRRRFPGVRSWLIAGIPA